MTILTQIVVNGNCVVCGMPLTGDRLILCEKCEEEAKKQKQDKERAMTREEAIKILKSKMDGSVDTSYEWAETVRMAIEALSADAVQGWIPFTRRPMTEEEQKDYPNCTFMFDCVLPDDGDEIFVSDGRFVWMDVFCNDVDGCYLDSGNDIDEDMAWMPLPEPYKGGDSE